MDRPIVEAVVLDRNETMKSLVIHHRLALDAVAVLALDLSKVLVHSPFYAGEDSSGRARHRPPTDTEVVARACDIADRLYQEFEKRGWLVIAPPMDVIREEESPAGFMRE